MFNAPVHTLEYLGRSVAPNFQPDKAWWSTQEPPRATSHAFPFLPLLYAHGLLGSIPENILQLEFRPYGESGQDFDSRSEGFSKRIAKQAAEGELQQIGLSIVADVEQVRDVEIAQSARHATPPLRTPGTPGTPGTPPARPPDRRWDDDDPSYDKAPGDPDAYSAGALGRHNAILTHMPDIGTTSAAAPASPTSALPSSWAAAAESPSVLMARGVVLGHPSRLARSGGPTPRSGRS
ncbi:hypothetical protein MKZ38_005914 [Zalerion maritima]|uniref:Uncharacterized protein n=1 Tax=Zalerion maritima TaxID=339359 RepID=A0AAD5RKH6_9PEZI|nr:hypothetical protein MKZ38_005914 [Zalerion maritima]